MSRYYSILIGSIGDEAETDNLILWMRVKNTNYTQLSQVCL
jgi:hypothetical protein